MIRYDQRHTAAPPTVPELLRSIDWILDRLRGMVIQYPARANDLRPRIDSALDERLRLMRLMRLMRLSGMQRPSSLIPAKQPNSYPLKSAS